LATVGIGTTFTPIAGDGPAAAAKVSYRVNKVAAKSAGKGLGNAFKGKSAQEIHEMFIKKGYQPRGLDPLNGKGGYVNPKNGRSYHIDEANRFGEAPHVDANRLPKNTTELPKKKYPF
jgi:hypothetical protein